MKNSMIKVTVNVIKSKSPISFNNRNTTTSPLQKSNPMMLSSSTKNPLPVSKSIPKDINTLLKLSTDETPTFDVESSETSSFLTKPQIQLNTKPRILSVIWTGKSKEHVETKTICPYESTSAPVDNNNNNNNNILLNKNNKCKVYYDNTKQDEEEDVSNFLNYKLGDINNDNESESIILGALNNFNEEQFKVNNYEDNNMNKKCQSQIKKYNKCNNNNNTNSNSNNNNIITSKSNNFHLIAKYANVNKNLKNQHLYKNSSLKEMEFDLSNLSPQLFSVDDFNTSYSRSIYNNDISEMKPNENINNVYMMNTCFTFSNQRNYNMFMNRNSYNNNNSNNMNNKAKNVSTKCVNEQKKKVMNGFRYDCCVNKNKNTITTKRCQTNPSTRIVKDKSKVYGNNNNNNNSNTHVNNKGINLKKSSNNINKKVGGNNNMKSSYVSNNTINNVQKCYKQNNNVTVIKYKNNNNNNGKGNNNLNCVGSKKCTKTVSTNQKRNAGIFMKDYKQQPQTWEH